MKPFISPASHDRENGRRLVRVALVLGVILIGFVALHSMGGANGLTAPTASTSYAPAVSAQQTADVESNAAAQNLICDQRCVLDCAVMAMICVMVLVISALVLVARYPAVHYRLLDAGERAVRAVTAARLHVYFPSLTVLSISRT